MLVLVSESWSNMDAVKLMGRIVAWMCELQRIITASVQQKTCCILRLKDQSTMANLPWCEPDCVINVGVVGPGVVRDSVKALGHASMDGCGIQQTISLLGMGQLVGREASNGWMFPLESLISPQLNTCLKSKRFKSCGSWRQLCSTGYVKCGKKEVASWPLQKV